MAYFFPTELHAIAFKHYDHIENAKDDVNFILKEINKQNLENFVKIYLESSQFNINHNIRCFWNQIKDPEYPSLAGVQEDMLIYLLNMYCCKINKKRRAERLMRGRV